MCRAEAGVVGWVKGVIHQARAYASADLTSWIYIFWARGCLTSTVGRSDVAIRKCIRNRKKDDDQLCQLHLFRQGSHLQEASRKEVL